MNQIFGQITESRLDQLKKSFRRTVENAIFKLLSLLFFQISNDYCQKSYGKTIIFYNGFREFL